MLTYAMLTYAMLTHADSLGGESKALMLVCASPCASDASETACSLNFASRVRNVELGTHFTCFSGEKNRGGKLPQNVELGAALERIWAALTY